MPRGVSEKPKLDPLLAALIEKLPAGGSEWSEKARNAWLQMAEMAFDVVYGAVSDRIVLTRDKPDAELDALNQTTLRQAKSLAQQMDRMDPKPPQYTYYIDLHGYGMGPHGRVMPAEVGSSTIYDMRGEADLNAIIWADDSRGVPRGMQLEISAVQ